MPDSHHRPVPSGRVYRSRRSGGRVLVSAGAVSAGAVLLAAAVAVAMAAPGPAGPAPAPPATATGVPGPPPR